jgi:amino-acid N-acetyltransferase
VTISPATAGHLPAIEALLLRNGLPIDEVGAALSNFLVAEHENRVVGVAGVEERDPYGLLRSVAIDESFRGRGLGRELVDRVIAAAETRRLKSLYLLTTTAERYFLTFGFTVTTRNTVPESIQQTREFQGACPASAIVMVRPVEADAKGDR